jgi:hypothetical protein
VHGNTIFHALNLNNRYLLTGAADSMVTIIDKLRGKFRNLDRFNGYVKSIIKLDF